MKKQTEASFWARVRKGDGCWEWQGCRNSTGYGCVGWHGVVHVTHRVAAWLTGMVASPAAPASGNDPTHVLHKCDNPACCRPDHFFLGNNSDNQKDAYQKKRKQQPRGEKHANAKLTDKQAAQIRSRYAAGELQVPLAREYGVSQGVVSKVLRGRSYK